MLTVGSLKTDTGLTPNIAKRHEARAALSNGLKETLTVSSPLTSALAHGELSECVCLRVCVALRVFKAHPGTE